MSELVPVEPSVMTSTRELIGAEVLVIDRDESVREGMTELLTKDNLHVTCVDDPSQAWELLSNKFFSVVVADLDTPKPNAGLETASTLKVASPTTALVMLTPRQSFADAVEALRAGAVDVILKSPETVGYLRDRIREAAALSLEKRQVDALLKEVRDTYDELLRRFMDADRRAQELDDRLSGRDQRTQNNDEIKILIVSSNPELANAISSAAPEGFAVSAHCRGARLSIGPDRHGSTSSCWVTISRIYRSRWLRVVSGPHSPKP